MDLERVVVDLGADGLEPAGDLARVGRLDDPLHRQHLHVRERLLDVVRGEPVVERDRRVEPLEERILRRREALGAHASPDPSAIWATWVAIAQPSR